MKTKLQMTFATLTLSAGLLLSAAAQSRNNDPQPQPKNPPITAQKFEKAQTPIRCKQAGSGDVKAKIIAFNNTGQTVKQGAVIHFTTNRGTTGTFTLNADLAVGAEKSLGKEETVAYTCTAYFTKN